MSKKGKKTDEARRRRLAELADLNAISQEDLMRGNPIPDEPSERDIVYTQLEALQAEKLATDSKTRVGKARRLKLTRQIKSLRDKTRDWIFEDIKQLACMTKTASGRFGLDPDLRDKLLYTEPDARLDLVEYYEDLVTYIAYLHMLIGPRLAEEFSMPLIAKQTGSQGGREKGKKNANQKGVFLSYYFNRTGDDYKWKDIEVIRRWREDECPQRQLTPASPKTYEAWIRAFKTN